MCFVRQRGLLVLNRLQLVCGESDYPHLLGILPDFKHCQSLNLSVRHLVVVCPCLLRDGNVTQWSNTTP